MRVYHLKCQRFDYFKVLQQKKKINPPDQVRETSMTKMLHNSNHAKCYILNILRYCRKQPKFTKRGCMQSDHILQFHAFQEVIPCVYVLVGRFML